MAEQSSVPAADDAPVPGGGPRSSIAPPDPRPPPLMSRPGVGKNGRRVDLFCNHFLVAHKPNEDAYHYDVCIMDNRPSTGSSSPGKSKDANIGNKNLTRAILAQVYKVYSDDFGGKQFAYDGEKGLYTAGSLPFRTQEFSVILEDEAAPSLKTLEGPSDDDPNKKRRVASEAAHLGRRFGREFKVKIEYAATIKMSTIASLLKGGRSPDDARAQDALRVLDIVMRQRAASKNYLLIKDNYFSPMFGVGDIGEGVQTCQGYHVSFRPSLEGLSLNLDIATTTLFKPSNVLDFIRERFQPANPSCIDWDKVKRILKGIKVRTRHSNIIHRIIGFSECSCAEQRFTKRSVDSDGHVTEAELTIQNYFEIQHNINLQFPHLPCIAAGRQKRPTYVPVELCHIIEGQRYTKALSSAQRQKMIDQARQTPETRRNVVQKAMAISEYNSDPLLRDFNVRIEESMRRVPGRILEPPSLTFRNTAEIPRNGRWNFNDKVMADGVQISSWVVLNFDGRMAPQNVERLCGDLARVCNKKGMKMPDFEHVFNESRDNQHRPAFDRVNNMLQQMKQKMQSPPAFLLCILPIKKTSDLYAPLKRTFETRLAIITQCIAPPRPPVKDQYLTNVSLKINAKIGGYNSLLTLEHQGNLPKVSRVPTVIFGLDVSHGPPGYSDAPSIAAVVASREWPKFSKYGVRLRAQSRKVEMVSGLFEESGAGGIIVELLRDFHSSCPKQGVPDARPKQIIIFRDGVSESQFEQVLREEFLAFKKACAHIDQSGTYHPKITLIVVQKRHHTRFFPANGQGNIAPGTVVDAGLCHPKDYDFYLSAHNGLIGTTRPTHYYVLVDEIGFTVDELQELTHNLCYIYARSTTAVSTVAPVAYAHLAATHARNFLDSEGGSETSSMTGRPERLGSIHFPDLHREMKSKMFYC